MSDNKLKKFRETVQQQADKIGDLEKKLEISTRRLGVLEAENQALRQKMTILSDTNDGLDRQLRLIEEIRIEEKEQARTALADRDRAITRIRRRQEEAEERVAQLLAREEEPQESQGGEPINLDLWGQLQAKEIDLQSLRERCQELQATSKARFQQILTLKIQMARLQKELMESQVGRVVTNLVEKVSEQSPSQEEKVPLEGPEEEKGRGPEEGAPGFEQLSKASEPIVTSEPPSIPTVTVEPEPPKSSWWFWS